MKLVPRRLDPGIATAAAVAALAAALRLPGLGQALWQDEVASARILREPTVGAMLARVARTESTPPLWYALGWLLHAAGVAIPDVRVLSVVAGALAAGLVVLLARAFLPLPVAALAGVLVAVGAELVQHGSELRAYELLLLLAVVFARCLLAELRAPSRRRELALGAAVAAGGLTHYFFAFTVLAALTWLWVDGAARAVRRRATVAIVAGALVAAAWAPVMLGQYHRDRFWWIPGFRSAIAAGVPLRLFVVAYVGAPPALPLGLAALALVALGAWRLRGSGEGRLVGALALGPLALAALVWLAGVRIFALRNLIEIAPFVAIAVAAVLTLLPRRAAVAIAAACAVAAPIVWRQQDTTPPYQTIAGALVRLGWQPSAPVAVYGNFFSYRAPLEWYLPRQPTLYVARPLARVCNAVYVVRVGEPRGFAQLASRHEHVGRFVVARIALSRPLFDERFLRGATLLTSRSSCVRPIRTGRTAPIA